MNWKKLIPLKQEFKNVSKGCLSCGVVNMKLKMNTKIVQSFGGGHITKNGIVFYFPNNWDGSEKGWKKQKSLMWVENQARKNPNNDWRFINNMPLHSEVYQRQGKNNWVMVEKGLGFA